MCVREDGPTYINNWQRSRGGVIGVAISMWGQDWAHVHKQLVIVCVREDGPTYINNWQRSGGMIGVAISKWGQDWAHVHKQLVIVCVHEDGPTYVNNWQRSRGGGGDWSSYIGPRPRRLPRI